jgi:pimeloyl-ACP methyl ester carboxylesterase
VSAAVQTVLDTYNTDALVTVGHSLGASLAVLDAMALPLHIKGLASVRTYAYGLPRTGNAVYAAYVDSPDTLVNLTRVTHQHDLGKSSASSPGLADELVQCRRFRRDCSATSIPRARCTLRTTRSLRGTRAPGTRMAAQCAPTARCRACFRGTGATTSVRTAG